MIALGLIGLLVAYVGLWSGFKGTDPRDEILAAFQGGQASPKLKEDTLSESVPTATEYSSTPTRGVSGAVR